MKRKIIFYMLVTIAAGISINAQEANANQSSTEQDDLRSELNQVQAELKAIKDKDKQKSMWGRQKTFKIGFLNNTWTPEAVNGAELGEFKPNYGFSLGLTKTYLLHSKPIAGCLKFGLEVSWFDISYTNYKANPDWSKYFAQDNPFGSYLDPDFEPDIEIPNLGSHQLDAGVGIGISANVTPFFWSESSNLRAIRAKLYGNFLPSFSAVIISEEDDTRWNTAFVPYYTIGGQLQWKALAFFVEGRWGSANYKLGGIDIDETDSKSHFDKVSCKNSGVRFGIGLCF